MQSRNSSRYTRCNPITLLALVLAGCGGGTEPSSASWADGTWRTVTVDGKPLPYKGTPAGSAYPFARPDSIVVFVFDPPLKGHAGDVFTYITSVFSATTTPTPLTCYDAEPVVAVSAATLSIAASFPAGCKGSFNFTRKGDSLATVWYGLEVRLVKRN